MSATAFKNAVRRREHRERSQPAARERFGLLEKHKDYQQRSRNFHNKEKRLADLRKKAENRNPDEFYFKMLSSGTRVRRTLWKAVLAVDTSK
jgi:U3 small nucleolar RNA-associated protein 11